ncbi:MAG: OmpA family protein [Chitinophagaceae bacterium]|nr:OmpA family protein [Chitinophagaceae bacterium]
MAGCPDSDNDGIIDSEDKCPTIAGSRENNGCPAIPKFNAANVQFVSGSAKLTSAALTELNSVVSYMKEYPETVIEIQGHTDNVGKESANQALSEKRAAAVAAALQKKGIDKSRISSAGYGMSQPVADNSTKEGKAKNRRVEFRISQKDKN